MSDQHSALADLMGTNTKSSNLNSSAPDGQIEYLNKLLNRVVDNASEIKIASINSDSSEGKAEYGRIMNSDKVKILNKEGFVASFEDADGERKVKDSYWKIVLEYRETNYEKVLEGLEKLAKSQIISTDLAMSLIVQRFSELHDRIPEIEKRFENIKEKIKKQQEKK